MKRILLSILLLVLVKVSVSAQPIAIPYSHGFEASADAENRNWICGSSTIKPGQTLFDTWTIGSLAAREGNKSLYATGRTDSLSMHSTDNLSIAYRKIEFPIAGTYDIVFDWRNDFGNTANSGLYVSFYKPGNMPNPDPVVNLTQSTDYTKAIAPTLVGMSANIQSFTFYDDKGKPYSKNVLSGDGRWQTSSFTTKSVKAGEVWYLVFIQKNAEQPGNEGMPSVIDNIQIAQHTALPQNIDVSHDCTDLIITWDNSVGDFYDIAYRQSHEIQYTTLFRQKVGQVGNRYEFRIPGLSEGVYDVMITSTEIRSGGEEVMGIAMPAHYNVAMCETMHCFDYLDLYAGNVQCYRGQLSQSKPGEQWEPQPVKTKPVDNGYYDPYSLHTVHFMPGETDPHTGGRSGHAPLKTKPDGELASVRIGNWLAQESKQATKEYAAVEYTVEVKESTPIILLKYAIVYQAPGHDKNKPAGAVREDPKFSLQVLSMQGEPLEDFEVCGKAEFYAEVDKEGSGWVTEDDKSTTNDIPVVWKDWTTMGINLRNLPAGTKYKIRISVQDCAQGAHWAYGYFALGCASGEIVGMACGEADIIPLEAPAGFRYRWYSEKDPSTTLLEGEEEARVYNAPAGTGEVFHVECSYIDDGTDYKDCSFDLDSRAVPSIPHSEFEFVHRPADCKNLFMLINRSHSDIIDGAGNRVCDKDDVTGKYKKPTSDVKWEIDGTELDAKPYGSCRLHSRRHTLLLGSCRGQDLCHKAHRHNTRLYRGVGGMSRDLRTAGRSAQYHCQRR